MSVPTSLPNLAELIAALLPAAMPATPASVASAPQGGADFASVLFDAREQADAPPEAQLPAERPELDSPEESASAPEALLAALVPDSAARIEPATLEPAETPRSDAGPVEPRAPEKPPAPPADAAPLLLAPSLVNLVLGTATAAAQAPRAETAGDDPPAPRATAPSERRTHTPLPPVVAREPHDPTARTPDFAAPEPARPARESEPRNAPQHESSAEPEPLKPPAADAPLQPPTDALAPRTTAHADAALRAAQESVPAANGTPAAADAGPARDPAAPAHAARALPELPARGEVEVVHSVRVLADQGGGRVHIRLDPPELGGLSLKVVVSDGSVHVSLLADQAPVADLLQRHSSELRSALEGHGLRLDQLDVGTGPADQGSRDAHPHEPDPRAPLGGRRLSASLDPMPLPMRRYDVSTLGVLDLHV